MTQTPRRIPIVDDNKDTRSMLRMALPREGQTG